VVFYSICGGFKLALTDPAVIEGLYLINQTGQHDLFAPKTSCFGDVQKSVIDQEKVVKITDSDLWEEYRALDFLRKTHPLDGCK
jgi:hypothetical protein